MSTETEDRPTIKNAELGYTFSLNELNCQCLAIHGAVAWPGKQKGFVIVIGMTRDREMYLLEEYESENIPDLVEKCGALNSKYDVFKTYSNFPCQYRWFGDYKYVAASKFIDKMNRKSRPDLRFSLTRSLMLDDDESFYPFIFAKLEGEYLKKDKKRLFLKGGKVQSCIAGFDLPGSEIYKMRVGDCPTIEAVAIAAIELQSTADHIHCLCNQGPPKSPYNNNILTRGLRGCAQR